MPAESLSERADPMDDSPKEQDITELTLRQLLLKRSTWFEDRMVEAADRYGYGFVTPAMNRLFAHMPRKPISMSALARRLAVSRQAVHQTVAEACARLRNVRFTERGLEMKRSAARAAREVEAELERRLGAADVAALRRILEHPWGEPPEQAPRRLSRQRADS